MTTQGTPQQREDAATAAIVVVLLSGLRPSASTAALLPVLATLGIPPEAGIKAASLLVPQVRAESLAPIGPAPRVPARSPLTGRMEVPAPEAPTPAQAFTRTTEVPRHSRYLVAAAKRFKRSPEPETMAKERHYLAQHLNAVLASREAAKRVDEAVARHGQALGWQARLDSATTPECRAAHGHTFDASRPPLIGYPGTLHGGTCRCVATTAVPGARSVDQATAHLRLGEAIPFPVELAVRS